MNLGLARGNVRRVLAAGVLISLAAVLAFRILWVGPRRDQLGMRRVELEQGRAEVDRARRAVGRLPVIEAEIERLRRRHAALRRALPESGSAPAVLRELQGMAGQAGLTMEAFTLEAVRVGERFEEWPVRLEMTGGFHDLAAFLDAVGRLPLIVTVSRVSIRALPAGSSAATIAVTCTATTYVFREPGAGEGASMTKEG